jgi:hypothetical protein
MLASLDCPYRVNAVSRGRLMSSNTIPVDFGANRSWPSEVTLIIRTVPGGDDEAVERRVGRSFVVKR